MASTRLRGADLVDQIAHNTKLQKHRWTEVYRRLCDRKAKIDIADAIVIAEGTPCDWFHTSSTTGEMERRPDSKLNAISIKKSFVKMSDPTLLSRQVALLLHEDSSNSIVYSVLDDLEFNLSLCQPSSTRWMTSFLLQPVLPKSKQHPQYQGTFVGKYNVASTTSCMRVVRNTTDSAFYELRQTPTVIAAAMQVPSISVSRHTRSSQSRVRSRTSSAAGAKTTSPPMPHSVENIIKRELRLLVEEIEAAFRERVRLLNGEFQITSTHRLMLVRVSHIVFFSDLKKQQPRPSSAGTTSTQKRIPRPMSAGPSSFPSYQKCAGGKFCHCKAVLPASAMASALMAPQALAAQPKGLELQQIARKSVQLSETESEYLRRFGAHAEAALSTSPSFVNTNTSRSSAQQIANDLTDAFAKLLQRRIFTLKSTLWNPQSDSFDATAMDTVTRPRLVQSYEMVNVCRACYLIYHTIDAERFQVSRTTNKAAVRKASALYYAKLRLPDEMIPLRLRNSQRTQSVAVAWGIERDGEESKSACDDEEGVSSDDDRSIK